jgi:hypothetical protein
MSAHNLNLEFVDEALALVRDAEEEGIHLRILGSVAYRLQCPQNQHLFDGMERALTDVDVAALKQQNEEIRRFMKGRGYQAEEGVYVASEGSRHVYLHPTTNLNVDVFADELHFCHRIPLKDRLLIDHPTISTTDLLLEKMQIVEINLKDFKDTAVLLLEHQIGSAQDSSKHIDVDYVARIMATDWGFYHTFTTNLGRVTEFAAALAGIGEAGSSTIRSRVEELLTAIEAAPKSMRWKIRAKIGTRMQWYQDVTEKSEQF